MPQGSQKKSSKSSSSAVPAYNALITTSKLNVIHAVISKILVDEVFGVYFFGLPDERIHEIQTMEQYLRAIGKTIGWLTYVLCAYCVLASAAVVLLGNLSEPLSSISSSSNESLTEYFANRPLQCRHACKHQPMALSYPRPDPSYPRPGF